MGVTTDQREFWGWCCGHSLGLCANEEALIMVMSPLLSLSLSPKPPSFKLQILIQICSPATATRTSCRQFPCGLKCQLILSLPPGADCRQNETKQKNHLLLWFLFLQYLHHQLKTFISLICSNRKKEGFTLKKMLKFINNFIVFEEKQPSCQQRIHVWPLLMLSYRSASTSF